jgi:arsenate reductase
MTIFRRDDPLNILFLCTGNSARSILAEALTNHLGRGRVKAYSAGSFPKGTPHPFALELLEQKGIEVGALRSKSWNEFAQPDSPAVDLVITVCDQAAGELCPIWPGRPAKGHWGIPDPAAVVGSEPEQRAAFLRAYELLQGRIAALLVLPLESMAPAEIQTQLREIAEAPA